MKTFLAAIALALCIHLPINGQRPDDVYSIGKTNFAFYQAKDQTEVMSRGITIFDNSSRDFPYISGAQRLDCSSYTSLRAALLRKRLYQFSSFLNHALSFLAIRIQEHVLLS